MKKFFRKSEIEQLRSLYWRYTDIISKIEKRHGLDLDYNSLWATNADVSQDFQQIGEYIHNTSFFIGELWNLAEKENASGTSKEDWEKLKSYRDDED